MKKRREGREKMRRWRCRRQVEKKYGETRAEEEALSEREWVKEL